MARGSGAKPRRSEVPTLQRDEIYDDVDEFHEQRDKVTLDDGRNAANEDDFDMEEPVLDITDDEDEDDAEEEEEEEEDQDEEDGGDDAKDATAKGRPESWGSKRNAYYNADNVNDSDDEEAAREEEEEAIRLQKQHLSRMQVQDFMPDAVLAERVAGFIKAAEGGVGDEDDESELVEHVSVDVSKMGTEEKLAILEQESPELLGLLTDFKQGVLDLKEQLHPLMQKVEAKEVTGEKGADYAHLKFHLIVSYCVNIAFYLLLKANGRSVKDHPVIPQLVLLRSLLDQLKPIDVRLNTQIKKLLEGRLPTVQAASTTTKGLKKKKAAEPSVKVSRKRRLKEKMAISDEDEDQEQENAPQNGTGPVTDLNANGHTGETFESTGKPKPKKSKLFKASADFGDLEAQKDMDDDSDLMRLKRPNLSQAVNDMYEKVKGLKKKSLSGGGEDDVPRRDVALRREQYQLAHAKHNVEFEDGDQEGHMEGVEHEMYKQAQAAKEAKKKGKKKDAVQRPAFVPTYDDTVKEDRKRAATTMIIKNRGLTPSRSRKNKNPRVKHRNKFEKALVRRRSGMGVRSTTTAAGPYGGESTGIKTSVARSVRFG